MSIRPVFLDSLFLTFYPLAFPVRLNRYLSYLLTVLVVVLLTLHLQHTQEYLFFFREQLMVFYNDAHVIAARYLHVGGPGLLLTHWLTQYFVLDYAGSVITAMLGGLTALLLWRSLPRQHQSLLLLPLCIMPVIFQTDALFDVYYAYQGYVAFFLFAVFAFLYRLLASRIGRAVWRMALACLLSLVLFLLAGSVGALLSVFLLVVDLTEHPRQSWMMLGPVALILIVASFCVTKAILPLYRDALLNSAYYEPILEPSHFFHTSWILALVLPLLAPLVHVLDLRLRPVLLTLCSVVLLALVSTYAYYSAQRNQQKMYPMIVLDHYIVTEDWETLLRSPYAQSSNFIMMNRVNLALSKSGRFLDDFFRYRQLAPYSIVTNLENLSLDVEITSTISALYYQMDNIASADERAFNSYEGLRYGSPFNLKMLVRTSLVFGRYQQAEKYIKMLERTTFYADWATAQRRFLYDDAAVESDPEYGSKRRSIPSGTREFVQARGPYADLLFTLRANPEARAARDYAIGYLLLANDVKHIRSFTEEFYGTPAMLTTPLRLQEAILAANEKDLDYCRAHGVEEQTIQHYQQLKRTLLEARQQGVDPQVALAQWRETYWYFLLVTSPRLAKMREQMMQQQEASKNQEKILS